MDRIERFILFLKEKFKKNIIFAAEIERNEGDFFQLPDFIDEKLKKQLIKNGISKLYLHQVKGLEELKNGKNIIVTTPTGSGKTLIYNLFILNEKIKNPEIKALYIFPTKALTQDQLKNLKNFENITGEIYDGDTPEEVRKRIKRKFPDIILTNPDMLHIGILPFHEKWREFFSKLKFVVIDEVHTYRGIFGSHVAHVIRRLRRICNLYGSNPVFILLSATIKEPEKFGKELTGLNFCGISESSSPSSKKYILFWDTGFESGYTQAVDLLIETVKADIPTILFTNSRRATELLVMWTIQKDRKMMDLISPYRAGYLPEERREIERKLFNGEIKGVIATSALELGIDIGYLDCCILFGYPGTIISTWQRIGRVGRRENSSLVIFMGLQDALDQYFLRNPEEFLKRKYEDVIINFENEIIAENHIKCASFENLIEIEKDIEIYGNFIKKIVEKKEFSKTKDGRFFYIGRPIHREINLRTIGDIFSIIDIDDGEIIGEIEEDKVFYECYPGSIYLHRGRKYEVIFINFEKKNVVVEKNKGDYYTQPNWYENVEILNIEKEKGEEFKIKFGEIEVTVQITGYEKRKERDRTLISTHMVNLPPRKFKTQSLWIEIPEDIVYELKDKKFDFYGSIHAAEHSIISVFPIEVTCDRIDLGGYSFPFHQQTQKSTIFIYDGYPGGAGITKTGFDRIEKIIEIAYQSVLNCKCEMGCPSCVQSPKCGNNNKPLDKNGALFLLKSFLTI